MWLKARPYLLAEDEQIDEHVGLAEVRPTPRYDIKFEQHGVQGY